MIYFRSDYSQGAHPKVMEALLATNMEHTDGYALDPHSFHAADMVREMIGVKDCSVYMMIGGTNCNIVTITAALKSFEAVVSARSGHAYFHETAGVEAAGHRVIAMDGIDGKLYPEHIDRAWDEFEDDHTPIPRMVYISQPTESGTVYSKAELEALAAKCRERNMLFYIDGARMASALTSEASDFTLHDIARLADAFYLGGTKNGALFGEALVIKDPGIDDHFRWVIKQHCSMLAKGRLIGVQFEALLEGGENSIWMEMARKANALAKKLRDGLSARGVTFYGTSLTNQVFPILPVDVIAELAKDFFFYEWTPEKDGKRVIRLVTGWGSTEEDVDAFLSAIGKLQG